MCACVTTLMCFSMHCERNRFIFHSYQCINSTKNVSICYFSFVRVSTRERARTHTHTHTHILKYMCIYSLILSN